MAVKGGEQLAKLLGTKVMDESGELTLNMVRHGTYCFLDGRITYMILDQRTPSASGPGFQRQSHLHTGGHYQNIQLVQFQVLRRMEHPSWSLHACRRLVDSMQQSSLDGGSYSLALSAFTCVLSWPFQLSDFDYAGKALNTICKEIRDTIINAKIQ